MSKKYSADSLGNRMKNYEGVSKTYLVRRMPVIIRLDGKAFHTFTKGFDKPFDNLFMSTMQETCKALCKEVQGCKIAYTQSDEISLLITDYDALNTSAWFDDQIQKMVSVSASIATLAFNKTFYELCMQLSVDDTEKFKKTYQSKMFTAKFDSRAFNLPKEDVCNYCRLP